MSWFRKRGLFLGWEERKLQKELQKPIALSEQVIEKKNKAFARIRGGEVHRETGACTLTDRWFLRKRAVFRWSLGFTCALVFFLGTGFYLNTTNPVLAQDLPIIGGVFKRIQERSMIWNDGDVSKYAIPLRDENGAYIETSNGVTVTISEAYVNPLNVYLAFKIKSETPLSEIECVEEEPEKIMKMLWDLQYEYSFMDEEYVQTKWQKENCSYVDGILVDDYTFEGVLIFDFQYEKERYQSYVNTFYEEADKSKAEIPDSFTINLNLTRIGGNKKDAKEWRGGYTETEYQALPQEEKDKIHAEIPKEYSSYPNPNQYVWFDGEWDFEIPVTVDDSGIVILEGGCKEYKIDSVKTSQNLIVKVRSGVGVIALDADGYVLQEKEIRTTDTIGEWEYRFLTDGYDISRVEIYGLGTRFYDEMWNSGKWFKLLQRDEEGRYGGPEIRAVMEEYQEYHKTIYFE